MLRLGRELNILDIASKSTITWRFRAFSSWYRYLAVIQKRSRVAYVRSSRDRIRGADRSRQFYRSFDQRLRVFLSRFVLSSARLRQGTLIDRRRAATHLTFRSHVRSLTRKQILAGHTKCVSCIRRARGLKHIRDVIRRYTRN